MSPASEIRPSDLDGVLVETKTNVHSYGSYEYQSCDVTCSAEINNSEPESLQPTMTVR